MTTNDNNNDNDDDNTNKSFPTEIERYYRKFYHRCKDKPLQDICVLAHSNKVCLITLAPSHPALHAGGPVQKLEYVVETGGKKVGDVHGKRKLEAIKLKIGTPLCRITAHDGTVYAVDSPIKGKLCELNDNLVNDVTLLTRMSGSNGYLAIVLHTTCSDDEFMTHLLTADQYADALAGRGMDKNVDGIVNSQTGADCETEDATRKRVAGECLEMDASKKTKTDDNC